LIYFANKNYPIPNKDKSICQYQDVKVKFYMSKFLKIIQLKMNKLDLVARFEIYKQLPGQELLKLCKTSKKFNEICNNRSVQFNNLWLQKIREEFLINLPYVENAVNYYRTYGKFLHKYELNASDYENIFQTAVIMRKFEIVEVLLKYSPLIPNTDALYIAVKNNDVEMARLLINDPRIANSDLREIFALSMQKRYIISKMLLENSPFVMQLPGSNMYLEAINRMIAADKGFKDRLNKL
jgi:hypothetical protein